MLHILPCPHCKKRIRVRLNEKEKKPTLEQEREAAPEVSDDPQDGSEHLSNWSRRDFSKNVDKGEGDE